MGRGEPSSGLPGTARRGLLSAKIKTKPPAKIGARDALHREGQRPFRLRHPVFRSQDDADSRGFAAILRCDPGVEQQGEAHSILLP